MLSYVLKSIIYTIIPMRMLQTVQISSHLQTGCISHRQGKMSENIPTIECSMFDSGIHTFTSMLVPVFVRCAEISLYNLCEETTKDIHVQQKYFLI